MSEFNLPCAARACVELLRRYGVTLQSKHVVVLGRSAIVGLPLSLLLLHHQATLSNCHRLTPLATTRALCQQADVVISAAGQPLLIKRDWIKAGAVILDVGINFIPHTHTEIGGGGRGEESGEGVGQDGDQDADENDGDAAAGMKLVGDVDADSLMGHAGALSPVPGGIGPMTVAMLMENTLNNFLRMQQQEHQLLQQESPAPSPT